MRAASPGTASSLGGSPVPLAGATLARWWSTPTCKAPRAGAPRVRFLFLFRSIVAGLAPLRPSGPLSLPLSLCTRASCAPTRSGKSSLLMQYAYNVAREGYRVLFVCRR